MSEMSPTLKSPRRQLLATKHGIGPLQSAYSRLSLVIDAPLTANTVYNLTMESSALLSSFGRGITIGCSQPYGRDDSRDQSNCHFL